ncbi:ribosome silencing factor [Wenyingzhuangia sp. 2_MG-2023]|uniref:ribosome silencing factor n=1 Tax=Wenyingzhuangia sp. 2_MG-2023 TaxID=3062639 RepID=UPI0026E3F572|nr:ribosome silencing factor [Wenyingzhuangia sp. 2_MG-2023]MDO6737821.1 ribosome silencing factor [Wenyingzhuangia sp. 2_MG-2023]MDO6802104.1 ribosome silencing factor [Wenyingzhuangia sp. 1_MG-2023]
MSKKYVSTDVLISTVLKGIDELKGEDIQLLDLREIDNTVCDYFIICSGTSNTHVKAISSSIQKIVGKEAKEKAYHVEGEAQADWVLLDYIHVVVHVFQKPTRKLYDIEGLWGDAKITNIPS